MILPSPLCRHKANKWSRNGPETVRFSSRPKANWWRTFLAVQGREVPRLRQFWPASSRRGPDRTKENTMSTHATFETFKTRLRGELLQANDASYEAARKV